VAIGSELREEKQVDPKPLSIAPKIMCLHEKIARYHIREGAKERGACA
jgi:hypothetical protein